MCLKATINTVVRQVTAGQKQQAESLVVAHTCPCCDSPSMVIAGQAASLFVALSVVLGSMLLVIWPAISMQDVPLS